MEKRVSPWDKLMDGLFKVIKWFVAIILLCTIALMFLEVIRRYCFGKTYIWSEELMRYMIIYATFIGGAAAFRAKSLVCFDLVSSKFPLKIKKYVDILNNTFIIVFLAFITKLGYNAVISPSIAKQTSTGLGISMSIPYAAIPIGCALMLIYALDNYRTLFKRLKEKEAN